MPSTSDRFREAYGEAIYETWLRGGDPDAVDADRVRDRLDETFDVHEAAEQEADFLCRRKISEPEEPLLDMRFLR